MKIIDCIWEDGKFKGTSSKGFYNEIEATKVAKADELRLKLSYGKKDVEFSLEKVDGVYDSLWVWEIDGEGYAPLPEKSCIHEWVNQGFHHIVMACKYCGKDAPNWIKN